MSHYFSTNNGTMELCDPKLIGTTWTSKEDGENEGVDELESKLIGMSHKCNCSIHSIPNRFKWLDRAT